MKKYIKFLCVFLSLVCILSFNTKKNTIAYGENNTIYLGGFPAGFTMNTRGAHIVGLCDVITKDGITSPSKEAGIKIGDILYKINDKVINNAKDVESAIKTSKEIQLELSRQKEQIYIKLKPSKDINGCYKIGVFIKDSVSGIGTVTFIKDGKFASLGHAVVDEDKEKLEILSGNLYPCNITNVIKGEKGAAGELRGVFLRNNPIATIKNNDSCGVFGEVINNETYMSCETIEVGEAKIGAAEIYTTIQGNKPKKYSISIVKNDYFDVNKNFVIKINDDDLITKTGGIVQGMSGSPIIQNNKLVGAVTHVFINDPTRGFGISINNMLNNL